jgi:hypothetical protein
LILLKVPVIGGKAGVNVVDSSSMI